MIPDKSGIEISPVGFSFCLLLNPKAPTIFFLLIAPFFATKNFPSGLSSRKLENVCWPLLSWGPS